MKVSKWRHVFIGGLHRSGTSILYRSLCDHPDVSGFRDTGVPEDEGQHLQSVFPTARACGGPGRFGYNPESYMDESSVYASAENRAQLHLEWGLYWDMSRPVLAEKSPPNLVRTRFLQAVFPRARFILIMRHPLAVSYATQKWSKTPLESLLTHWLICHRRMRSDLPFLKRALVLRYEDLVARPAHMFSRIHRFVGVEDRSPQQRFQRDINAAYFDRWRQDSSTGGIDGRIQHRLLALKYELAVRRFGYSMVRPDQRPVLFAGSMSDFEGD